MKSLAIASQYVRAANISALTAVIQNNGTNSNGVLDVLALNAANQSQAVNAAQWLNALQQIEKAGTNVTVAQIDAFVRSVLAKTIGV